MPSSNPPSRAPVVACVMMSMAMIAIEATIVSTAMPRIVAQLGGVDYYSWVFAGFLLTQTATTVIFGKLADVYGRKPVMLSGIFAFLVGSVLCGLARSMPAMIGYRLIQGVGAGAIAPVGVTIIGDLFPGHERGKVQGYLAGVWAISAVLGPVLGGVIIRNLAWAWVFWINVPIALIAALGYASFLQESKAVERPVIDVWGAILSTVAIASLMVSLTQASRSHGQAALAMFVVCLVSSFFFIRQESRVSDPMISLELWRRRPILAANVASMLASMTLMALTSFLPMYMQVVLHRSPTVAGLALTMMLVGWPASATIAARTVHRVGIKRLFFRGSICLPLGASFFLALSPASSAAIAGIGSLIMGFGMGNISISSVILIQEIVGNTEKGSATASNLFSRNIGSTFGAALFGAVFNIAIVDAARSSGVLVESLRQSLDIGTAPLAVDPAMQYTLQHALHLVFVGMFLLSLFIVLVTARMPSIELGSRPTDIPASKPG